MTINRYETIAEEPEPPPPPPVWASAAREMFYAENSDFRSNYRAGFLTVIARPGHPAAQFPLGYFGEWLEEEKRKGYFGAGSSGGWKAVSEKTAEGAAPSPFNSVGGM